MDSRQFHNEESYNTNTSSKNSSILCRQSSTRWIPTEEQVRILKDLYYNRGVRSPTAEQIQKISSLLGQYGKIEGKNVFYWFQNHKARERQKKKLCVETTNKVSNGNKKKYNSNISQGVSAGPSAGLYSPRGETESWDYGATYLKECSLGGGCFYEVGEVGFESAAPTPLMQYHFTKDDSTQAAESHEMDILQLFPAHSNERGYEEERKSSSGINYEGFNLKMDEPYGYYRAFYCDGAGQQLEVEDCHHQLNGGHLASLELSLSPYCGGPSST